MAKLTEQDILNWDGPEEDYMNSDQLAFFRELLVKMQDELIENASATTGHLQEHESAPDPADRATQEEEYALELRTRCLLYTSPSPRDATLSRMPSSA